MQPLHFVIAVLFALGAGCGRSSVETPDVAKFRDLTAELNATAVSHRAEATAMAASPACETQRDSYAATMQPKLDELCAMSGPMDQCMDAMGHTGMADMDATCMQMCAELAKHLRDACAPADPALRQTETERHGDAMLALAGRENERASSMQGMQGMMGSGGMMGGGTCQR